MQKAYPCGEAMSQVAQRTQEEAGRSGVKFWPRLDDDSYTPTDHGELIRSTIFPHILDPRDRRGCFIWTSLAAQAKSETRVHGNREPVHTPRGRSFTLCRPRLGLTPVIARSAITLCFHTSRRKRRTLIRGLHREAAPHASDRTRTNERWPARRRVLLHPSER